MNDYLSSHTYFSGTDQPGLADFMMLFPLFTMLPEAIKQGAGATDTSRGKLTMGQGLRDWWTRVEAR
jgi:hypothetical protein